MILKPYINNNKIVNIVVGNPGEGKTIFTTFIATGLYFNEGYTIYSNYTLKHIPYYDLTSPDDFKQIIMNFKKNPKEKVAIFLDEIYRWADSRKSQTDINVELAGYITQVRKMGASSRLWGSTQTWKQFESRIRLITSQVFEPKILLADENNAPRIIRIETKDLTNDKFKTIKKFNIPTIIDGFDILECYDTHEFIENLNNIAFDQNRLILLVKTYWDINLDKKGKLSNYIFNLELGKGTDLTQKEASSAAEFIITCREDFGLSLKEALAQIEIVNEPNEDDLPLPG